tara:strand:- start:261 stop:422 length:162 start_codon:yes stop_codon:yes gene_type:complete
MGKIDWYCRFCDLAFRAYDGRCPECHKPIRPINKFKLTKPDQLTFDKVFNNNE